MFRSLYNQARLRFVLNSRGPFLVRSGPSGSAAAELPDVACARTFDPLRGEDTVFVPGGTIKGALRVRAERILRSVGLPACDPFPERGRDRASCWAIGNDADGFDAYRRSCYACRLFGSSSLAGRLAFCDAMPGDWDADGPDPVPPRTEVRAQLAIDRVLGSAAFGPFDFEVAAGGTYAAEITLRDFPLWTIAILGIALRDLDEGFITLGAGGARGLGRFGVSYRELVVDTFAPVGAKVAVGAGGGGGEPAAAGAVTLHGVEALATDRIRDTRRRDADTVKVNAAAELYGDYAEWGRRRQVFTGGAVIAAIAACIAGPWRGLLESPRSRGGGGRGGEADGAGGDGGEGDGGKRKRRRKPKGKAPGEGEGVGSADIAEPCTGTEAGDADAGATDAPAPEKQPDGESAE